MAVPCREPIQGYFCCPPTSSSLQRRLRQKDTGWLDTRQLRLKPPFRGLAWISHLWAPLTYQLGPVITSGFQGANQTHGHEKCFRTQPVNHSVEAIPSWPQ